MKPHLKVFFHTFGCKANSCETEAVTALLESSGYGVATDIFDADIVVVNSCTVTAEANRKACGYIRRAKRLNPDAVTVLTGCYPQAFPESASALDAADIVTGSSARENLPSILSRYLEDRKRVVEIRTHREGDSFWHVPVDVFHGRTRAFIKVEDGCDRACSYCIVPQARGPVRSLSPDMIREQAVRFADGGYKEIVLSGINLSSYGKGENFGLSDAVFAADVSGIERIRLSSLEPDLVTDALIKNLSGCEKLCPHFHLPLQSASDRTLKSMGRLYSARDFENTTAKLRLAFDNPTFTTDVIAGFPTETDADFRESLDFIIAFGFLKCHVFPYSPREGTSAALLPQLPKKLREERAKILLAAADSVREKILHEQTGTAVSVITQRKNSTGELEGYSERYIPVAVNAPKAVTGDLVKAVITGVRGDVCTALPSQQ